MIRQAHIILILAAVTGILQGAAAQENFTLQDRRDATLLEEKIASVIQQQGGDSIRVQIRVNDLSGLLDDETEFPVRVTISPLPRLYPGKQVVTLDVRDDTGALKRHYVNVELTLWGKLAFPTRLIKRGEVIHRNDITIRETDLKSVGSRGLVLHPEAIIGLAATRHLSPTSPLRWDQLEAPSLVQKGDRVDVFISADAFSIKTAGTALQTGSLGEKIWVRLEGNGKRMRAVVVDADRVRLE